MNMLQLHAQILLLILQYAKEKGDKKFENYYNINSCKFSSTF